MSLSKHFKWQIKLEFEKIIITIIETLRFSWVGVIVSLYFVTYFLVYAHLQLPLDVIVAGVHIIQVQVQ